MSVLLIRPLLSDELRLKLPALILICVPGSSSNTTAVLLLDLERFQQYDNHISGILCRVVRLKAGLRETHVQ